ncbi:MAG: biotin--[acetyl-CoA-carboxylase] ligase [Planctomycetota bacterium]|jgi:BirA family biotin operon repressor/biotin-[acetyl-CoA-carboxylase] ligase
MNRDLISYLKKQTDFIPAAVLEEKTGLCRNDLFSDVEELIEEGYNVEFHPYLGVKLIDIPDRLLKHEIRDGLNTKRVGRKLKIHDTVESTNVEAWKLLEEHEKETRSGTLVIAENQTAGRGRMGREWHSMARRGLWFSVILKINIPQEKLAYLTAAASLAVANMMQQFGHFPAEIKWPNDIMIRGRKVAGILVEARSDHPGVYVLGVGLNVNQLEGDFPESIRETATSLRMERSGHTHINRLRVLRPLLFYIERVFNQVKRKKWDRIAGAWSEFVRMGGKHVSLQHGGNTITGTIKRVHPVEGITLKLNDVPEGEEDTQTFTAEGVGLVREVPEPEPMDG